MPFNSIFAWMMKKRIHQIDLFRKYPGEVQEELFFDLIEHGKQTDFGKSHRFNEIANYSSFASLVPLHHYEDLSEWIEKAIEGRQNVLWTGETKWFAKSSGTTGSRSKLIPVTRESLENCHYKGGKDLLAIYYENHPNRKLYNGRHLIVGGSAQINQLSNDSYFGDLSAIIVKNLPWWAEIRRTPAKEIALLSEWEEKIERMAHSTIKDDVYIIAGVPSWTMVLANKVLEITGKENLKEVWPNLELFMHGGVSFDPYREQFSRLIPHKGMNYVETYNASEGFFGIQDQKDSNELLLMLDYGIFYEFIPMEDYQGTNSRTVVPLNQVEPGVNYAVVITTNGGLWRYILGDTIRFTSIRPYRFKITGRTKSFINAFGEELIVENAEKALAYACALTNAQVRDYTVAPCFMKDNESGVHEWLIEFVIKPDDSERFIHVLDEELRRLNSDYDAKRSNNFILKRPKVIDAPKGIFDDWLRESGKLGGQNKIPRLSNDRKLMEQLLLLKEERN